MDLLVVLLLFPLTANCMSTLDPYPLGSTYSRPSSTGKFIYLGDLLITTSLLILTIQVIILRIQK